jgi:hypothetical protein
MLVIIPLPFPALLGILKTNVNNGGKRRERNKDGKTNQS